jgi:hypothetical protein
VKLQKLGVWIMFYGVGAIFLPLIGLSVDVCFWMDRFSFPINLAFKLAAMYWGYKIWRNQDD